MDPQASTDQYGIKMYLVRLAIADEIRKLDFRRQYEALRWVVQ